MAVEGLPAYEALASLIKAAGVTCTFGLMSDDTALLISALDTRGVRFYGARHENQAIAMAAGYSSATLNLGIAIIGRGPALANSLHAAAFTRKADSKVLIITGSSIGSLPDINALGPEQKSFNGIGVLAAVGIKVFEISNVMGIRETFIQSLEASCIQTTALFFPINVQSQVVNIDLISPFDNADSAVTPLEPSGSAIRIASDILAHSSRPVILAGRGAFVAGARKSIINLADHIGAILTTTLKAQDLFRGHPFNCGIVGSFSNAASRYFLGESDCLLVLGASLNQRTTSFGTAFKASIPIIQVDSIRAHIGRWFPVDVNILGDVGRTANALMASIKTRAVTRMPFRTPQVKAQISKLLVNHIDDSKQDPKKMDPRIVASTLDQLLPKNRNVIYDVGNFMQVAQFISVLDPGHVKYTADFASVGLGFGAALGFAAGRPSEPTFLIIGDGGLLMTLGELETTAREGFWITVIVMNDCAYGAELHYLHVNGASDSNARFPDIDFEPIARAFGFDAATIRSVADLKENAELLSGSGPTLIDCKIRSDVIAPFLIENFARNEKYKHNSKSYRSK